MKNGKKLLGECVRMVLLLMAVSIVAFLLITKAPIDPLVSYVGTNSTLSEEAKEEIAEEWGLNDPLPERFATWVKHAVHGDLGMSITYKKPVIEVIKTYCFGSNTKVVMVPEKDGVTDGAALEEMLKADPQAACFYVQQPNYYGNIEDGDALGRIVHEAGAKYIMGCNPMALAVMKTPAEYGADIAVGDGQPLGMPLAFGGPYLGFMTATAAMTRKLPGRIVGETADHEGRRAFVLTLQAREQHIRREKASSNVCSNQAWCALTASVYMTAMGADGMAKAAGQCMSKAHYLRDVLKEAGLEPKHNCEFFHEFVTVSPEGGCTDSAHILRALESKGILGGLPLSDREILWCATEMNTREEMDELASAVREALHRECGQKEVCGS